MRIGITGHQELGNRHTEVWVRNSIRRILEPTLRPVGLSSLAFGSDQLFAELILSLSGILVAVVPFPGYESRFTRGRQAYESLLSRADDIVQLEARASDEESYYAAGKWIVDHCDRMIGVWNGLPAKGIGGTADVVQYAKEVGRGIALVNPADRTIVNIPARQANDV